MNVSGRAAALSSLGGLVALVGVVMFTGSPDQLDEVVAAPDVSPTETLPDAVITAPTTPLAAPDLPDRGVHPPLRDIDGWLQADVTSLEELREQIKVIDAQNLSDHGAGSIEFSAWAKDRDNLYEFLNQ